VIEEKSWSKPPVFDFLEKMGGLDHREMFNVFNMGIGMILVVDPEDKEQTISLLQESGEKPVVIGKITDQPTINLIFNE
jgi:phosphoribosylformylglycinamidine cyclo-ligase